MVILFDELGVYLEEWLHDHVRAGNIALQSILEACRNRPGKVCFVSFIQRDPDQYANFAQPDEVGVTRFTTRLPSQTRFTLAANLELVLESLIQKPDRQQWESFMRVYIRQLESASRQTMAALLLYYDDKWTDDDFIRIVAKGAFPLHPLTASLLCHLDFAQRRIDADLKWLSVLSDEIEKVSNVIASPDEDGAKQTQREHALSLYRDVISREKLYTGTPEAESLQAHKRRLEEIERELKAEDQKKAKRDAAVQRYLNGNLRRVGATRGSASSTLE